MSDVLIGVAAPQANPTVDIEFQRFFRGPARAIMTRLTSRDASPSARLVDYIEQLPAALASFDTMPLRAFAFACTASSYLVGHEREDELREAAEQQFRVQIVTATQAIRRELEGRGARRIAMLAPYPQEIIDKAVTYWSDIGFDIAEQRRIDIGDDTRAIYTITDQEVIAALDNIDAADCDVILLSGTGMPTIEAMRQTDKPVLSSNLCLATEMLRRTQLWPPHEAADIHTLLGGR